MTGKKRIRQAEEEVYEKRKRLRDGKPIWLAPRGLVPPGYSYLGPGNPMDNGPAQNKNDWVAQKHDDAYGRHYLTTGQDPVKNWVKADEDFLKEIEVDGLASLGAKAIFKGKKALKDRKWIKDVTPLKKSLAKKSTDFNARRIIPDSATRESLRNTREDRVVRSAFNMAETGSGHKGDNGAITETPVDDVGTVYRGPPDYTFSSLPFYWDNWRNGANVSVDLGIRMTSPYDAIINYDTDVDMNAGAGASTAKVLKSADPVADGNTSKARWFDFYAGIYKYYHVISCRWKATFENNCSEPLYVHQMYMNDVVPPVAASNRDMMCWSGVDTKVMRPQYYSVTTAGFLEKAEKNSNEDNVEAATTAGAGWNYETSNNVTDKIGTPIVHFSGEYRPGDFDRQIRQDTAVENWTAVSASPGLREALLFRVKPYWDSYSANDADNRNRDMFYRQTLELEYLVEFKELKDGLKYPVSSQPYTVTIVTTNTN